ncbi:MAG: tetratricopeptide repeat protein [Gemmatimonadota bacterium]|nr:MAG: tetratricopeptide repeat protein [Gemmatimonadota bacterium]
MKLEITARIAVARVALAAATLVVLLLPPLARESQAAGQQEPGGRFRVLVVPLESSALDKKFGGKVADEIRKRLEDFSTHAPIPVKEYSRALKQYEVKEEELNAIKARQLANLMGAQVAFYGTIEAAGGAYRADGVFIGVQSGDELHVPAVTISDKSNESVSKVADAAIAAFQQQVQFDRAVTFCADYVGSQQPENAIRNCNEALAINPGSVPALFNKGLAFRQMFEGETAGTNGWADSAVHYFERVLEVQPGKREAMQNAAYIYSKVGAAEKASELYKQYLELDPGNVPVRLKVAYDLAQAELMVEAIEIIQAGLEFAEEDVDLLQSLGDYSLRYSSQDSTYLDTALEAYEKVLRVKGEETDLTILVNALAAYTQANRTDEAIAFAERALQSHSDSPRLWAVYADALGRKERYREASAAMDKVLELDPSYANAYLKRGQFKLRAGDEAAGMADFTNAIESGSSSQDDVFRFFWGEGHAARNEKDYSKAISEFERANRFVEASQRRELEFWWAYTYYQLGEQQATPEGAGVSQLNRAQSNFQAAVDHFERAGNVRAEVAQLKDAADKWLLNIDARIRRAQRG